jgi:hypothetical protein
MNSKEYFRVNFSTSNVILSWFKFFVTFKPRPTTPQNIQKSKIFLRFPNVPFNAVVFGV